MERAGAESILTNRSDGTFLVRQRVKDAAEFAISIKYNVEVKHIKIMTAEGLYRITEKKAFRGLVVRANLPPNPRPSESGQDCP
nr:PREDICTED: proto-oncogene vav-like [Equus przewalskii]